MASDGDVKNLPKAPVPLQDAIKGFSKDGMTHTEAPTIPLPTKDDITQEKVINTYDELIKTQISEDAKKGLKHVETQEKNTLPTKEDLIKEKEQNGQ